MTRYCASDVTGDSDPPWFEQRRKLFMRPDAQRYLRHDFERFLPPAAVQVRRDAERAESERRAFRQQLADLHSELETLKCEEAAGKVAFRRDPAALREANQRAFQRVRAMPPKRARDAGRSRLLITVFR
jgi:hypothetical protein